MNLLQVFGIGENRILAKGVSVSTTVTGVQRSYLYVIKKPVRLYPNDSNTLYSHYFSFEYTVDGVRYRGKRFVSPNFRCPNKGETIEVFYDPDKPENYALYSFGPAVRPIGW